MTDGLVVVDKPAGWTSHDVVARCRKVFGQKRVGHAGTLDPDATGVLLVGLGRVTRLLRFLTALPKSYVGELVLGVETSTFDAAGDVSALHDMTGVTAEDVRSAARSFVGTIQQVPPMVSAVKVGGRRAHALAREGTWVTLPPRPVTVDRLEVSATADPLVYRMDVDCSSGTYVRSLAHEIGRVLGGGAHLRALRRTAIGSFRVDEARPLDDLRVLLPAEALRDYPSITVDDEDAGRVMSGRTLGPLPGDGFHAVLDRDGRLLAVYEPATDGARAAVVVAPSA